MKTVSEKKATSQTDVGDLTSDLDRQHKYVEQLQKRGERGFALVAADAFVRGMRDSGYKTTATAIDEFIDNAIQAQATRIDVVYTTDKQDGKQVISNIAVVDDGHGMEEEMVRAAVLWGGTHRENDRSGFGRYGFGLPSAAVSITKRFEVYSRITGSQWHRVRVDLDAVCAGKLTNKDGLVIAPKAEAAELPPFVEEYLGKRKLEHGSVILLVEPDRLTAGFRNAASFHNRLMEHVGLMYRGSLRQCSLYVNGKKIEPVDPLFLDSGARFYDVENGILAEGMEALQFDVDTYGGDNGRVRLRFSYMPPGFQRGPGRELNQRFSVMKDNNAYFILTRAGRQIDLLTRSQFSDDDYNFPIQVYDRNWAIEMDFDPILDEEFGITVNKQQVTISDRMWQILEAKGVHLIARSLNRRYTKEARDQKAKADKGEEKTSESIMVEAEKFESKPVVVSPEKEEAARQKIENAAEEKAKLTNRSKEEHIKEIINEVSARRYEVHFESLEGAPFYRAELYGPQVRLFINTRHRFYTDLYEALPARAKAALELLLFILGRCEIEASGDREIFYRKERGLWSERLDVRFALLDRRDSILDAGAANQEESQRTPVLN